MPCSPCPEAAVVCHTLRRHGDLTSSFYLLCTTCKHQHTERGSSLRACFQRQLKVASVTVLRRPEAPSLVPAAACHSAAPVPLTGVSRTTEAAGDGEGRAASRFPGRRCSHAALTDRLLPAPSRCRPASPGEPVRLWKLPRAAGRRCCGTGGPRAGGGAQARRPRARRAVPRWRSPSRLFAGADGTWGAARGHRSGRLRGRGLLHRSARPPAPRGRQLPPPAPASAAGHNGPGPTRARLHARWQHRLSLGPARRVREWRRRRRRGKRLVPRGARD